MIGGQTRVFALLGDPVGHSLSPFMHNAAFRILGLDAVYVPLRCSRADVGPLIRSLAAAGGGGNVTVPHKREAAQVLGAAGLAFEACNTFWGANGGIAGTETDSLGIAHAWRAMNEPPGDWLVVGTGGSAVAAARAAQAEGAGVAVRSRSASRRAAFLKDLHRAGIRPAEETSVGFVINCTPLGLHADDPLPVDPDEMPDGAAALDLGYAMGGTPWVRVLVAAGFDAHDGRDVLLEQGAAAFECWFPGLQAPREAMRAALEQRLG